MIRARVKLLGTGKTEDPFRVALPSYHMISTDEANGVAVVDIPDDAYPTLPDDATETVTTIKDQGRVVTALSNASTDDTRAFYDEKYREHAGKFVLDLG